MGSLPNHTLIQQKGPEPGQTYPINRPAVVIGRDDTFTIYTNVTKIGEITTEGGLEKGFVAFVALNESGYTDCQYDNAWLWLMEESS